MKSFSISPFGVGFFSLSIILWRFIYVEPMFDHVGEVGISRLKYIQDFVSMMAYGYKPGLWSNSTGIHIPNLLLINCVAFASF